MAAREQLEPLEPGERPGAVTAGAIVAALLGLANLAALALGLDVSGEDPQPGGVVLFSALMFAAAVGMWRVRYWAVLGFQALLALTMVIAALSLLVASNLQALAVCLGLALPSGFLFWKLIRAMARIQMPQRPGAR